MSNYLNHLFFGSVRVRCIFQNHFCTVHRLWNWLADLSTHYLIKLFCVCLLFVCLPYFLATITASVQHLMSTSAHRSLRRQAIWLYSMDPNTQVNLSQLCIYIPASVVHQLSIQLDLVVISFHVTIVQCTIVVAQVKHSFVAVFRPYNIQRVFLAQTHAQVTLPTTLSNSNPPQIPLLRFASSSLALWSGRCNTVFKHQSISQSFICL